MHSRAYLLLQKEFRQFRESQYHGITAIPMDENMMDWDVHMEGLLGTPWQGLFFHLTLNFTSEYNLVPPVVKFKVAPFHPNVHQVTGQPCVDFLDNLKKWNEGYTLSSILLSLQVMLSEPVLHNPVNLEAARMLMSDQSTYMLINNRIFKEAILSASNKDKYDFAKGLNKPVKLTKRISFNDYYETWCKIATSKVNDYHRTQLLEDPNFLGMYNKWKAAEQKHSKEWTLKFIAALFQYNRENKFNKPDYQAERNRLNPSPVLSVPSDTSVLKEQSHKSLPRIDEVDLSSEEVDDLLGWANTLDEASLEED